MLKRRVATPPTRRNTRTSQSHPLTKRLRPKGIDRRSAVRNAGPFQMLVRRRPPPCMCVFMAPLKIPLTRSIGRGTLHVIGAPQFNRCARRFEPQAHLLLERREDGSRTLNDFVIIDEALYNANYYLVKNLRSCLVCAR